MKPNGPALWRALHDYALSYPRAPSPEDMRLARAWLDWFKGEVARLTGCACHSDWHVMLKVCPPAIHTRQSFYLWTVAAHDRINRRLNKPLHSPEWSSAHPLLTTA